MKKPKVPTQEQQEVLKAYGLQHYLYEVMKDMELSLIVRHRITGEYKLLSKSGPSSEVYK